jgi:F0F1-type ATP synthase delta subunit
MFELAPNFDEHPSFRKVLADPSLPAEGKMKLLSQVISDQEWREASELYDRGFWLAVINKRAIKPGNGSGEE